jgi:hypothetical protein
MIKQALCSIDIAEARRLAAGRSSARTREP